MNTVKKGDEVAWKWIGVHYGTLMTRHRDGTSTVREHTFHGPDDTRLATSKLVHMPKVRQADGPAVYRLGRYLLVSNATHNHDDMGLHRGRYSWTPSRRWYAVETDENHGYKATRLPIVEKADTRKELVARLATMEAT